MPLFGLAVSAGVKVAIPLNKPPDSVRERSARPKADSAFQVRAIGKGLQRIAGLYRQEFANRRPADGMLDLCDDLQQLHRLTVTDVINMPRRTAGRRIGPVARPCRVGRRRTCHETYNGLGY